MYLSPASRIDNARWISSTSEDTINESTSIVIANASADSISGTEHPRQNTAPQGYKHRRFFDSISHETEPHHEAAFARHAAQPSLMFASFTMRPHLSISAATKTRNSSGVFCR